jgi:hypothetical protein
MHCPWNSRVEQYQYPNGVAVSKDKEVYIANYSDVQVFDLHGQFLRAWDSNGTFQCTMEIAVSRHGEVFVTDHDAHSVQVFLSNGTFLWRWGAQGNAPGQFESPHRIAVAENGEVFVVDKGNKRIQVFTSQGVFLRAWGSEAVFSEPTCIALSWRGEVFVTDYEQHCVLVFQHDGTWVRQWRFERAAPPMFQPVGIAVSLWGDVLVCDNGFIRVFGEDGTFRRMFIIPDAGVCAGSVALVPNHGIVCAISRDHCLYHFE